MSGYGYPLFNVPQYPGVANFPTPSASTSGPTALLSIDQNTQYLYMWDLTASVWRLIATPGAGNEGYTTTATAAGTSTLTVSSTAQQFFTGTTTQTVVLPVTSTLVLGQSYIVVNSSTGVVTVQSSGANTIQAMQGSTVGIFTCISLSGTGTSSWQFQYYSNINATPTASVAAAWDANLNMSAANFLGNYATTATAAGTTALLVGSKEVQYFTGSTTQTVTLPVVSTLVLGQAYQVVNESTGVVTVQSSGANTLVAQVSQSSVIYRCVSLSGTGTASWQIESSNGQYIENVTASGSAVSVTSGAATDVDSGGGSPVGIVLTAGVWDISLICQFVVAASTSVTKLSSWVGTATGNATTGQDTARNYASLASAANVMNGTQSLAISPFRVTITGSTTYYLKATATFSVSTLTAYGSIRATRVY